MKLLYRDIPNEYGYIQLQHWPDSKKREGTAAVRMRCILWNCILVHTFEYLWIAQGGKRHCILVDSLEPKPKEANFRIAQALLGKSRRALARPPDEESEAGPSLPELLRGIWGNSPSRVLLAQCSVLNARPAVTKFHSVTHCSVQSALTMSWTHLSYFAQVIEMQSLNSGEGH